MFKRIHDIFFLLTLVVVLPASCAAPNEAESGYPSSNADSPVGRAQPFFDARTQTAEYAGPGRDDPAPDDLNEIKIGWFGPADPRHPTAGAMWSAATLAIEEANSNSGYNGIPFRLVASWSENPWGTGIKDVTRLAYDDRVWGIVGAPDGPSAHLVEQVVAKARIVFLSPVSTDSSTNLVNVPWIFSLSPNDDVLASVLAEAIANAIQQDTTRHNPSPLSKGGKRGGAIVSFTDHDSRVFTTELLAALKTADVFPSLHLQLSPSGSDFTTALQRINRIDPRAVALIGSPRDSARFLTALRADGLDIPVFGSPAMGHSLFAATAGQFAANTVFPILWSRSRTGARSAAFAQRFTQRFGHEPDYTAAYTYDAMNLLIDAIRKAGLNRARIRDAVRSLSPWEGVTGTITWNPTGRNMRPAQLNAVRDLAQPAFE